MKEFFKKIFSWIKTHLLADKKNLIFSCCALVLTIVVTTITGISFGKFSNYEPYFWGTPITEDPNGNPNVKEVLKFSDFSPSIKGTAGDANIYVMEGEEEGPSILILGGTHPNEPSGQIAATLFLENIHVVKGTVYIITETNRSAYTHSHPQEASAFYYHINVGDTVRTFKYGSRATNTNQQWPNPDIYVHEYSGQKLSTNETRNLNRAYPGVANGTYTERVAFAVTELVKQKDINMVIDLHEASPEYLTINAIVAHNRARIIADGCVDNISDTIFDYHYNPEDPNSEDEALKKDIHAETSPSNLHGLTHRELGDYTNTLALLAETSNASQGKYRGAFNEELIAYEGYSDKFYEKSVELEDNNMSTRDGMLYARPVSLTERVARHCETIAGLISSYNKRYNDVSLYTPKPEAPYDILVPIDGINGDMTPEKLLAHRVSEGAFEINYGKLFRSGDDSMYQKIMDTKVAGLLHPAQ